MAAEQDTPSRSCTRCARALPPGPAKVCVYCGGALSAALTKGAALVPGFSAPPLRDPLVGRFVAGRRFQIEELIGQGGMGKVYRARHLALDRAICLKMLKPALLEDPTLVGRFEREAKAASRLNHPNGIQVLDFGRDDDGGLFIAMEYVQGKDLRIVLRDEWPLPEERLCTIIAQVLSALAAAHAHKVIHRDLKPENIMVEQRRDQRDFVKVLDFGIAKILDSDLPGLTRGDVVCGTPQYMAPEQATGTQLDARCDLYAVGVLLYQLATGHLPFDGDNSMEVLTRHVNELPVPPRKRRPEAAISPALEALILRALQKDPELRPQSAEEFRDLLLAVPGRPAHASSPQALATPVRGTPLPAARQRFPPAPGRLRNRAAAAAGLFAAGAAAAASMWSLRSRSSQPETRVPVAAATVAARPAPARDPERARELVLRASESEAAAERGAALAMLEEAVLLDPDNAEAHYRLGGLCLADQPDRARTEYEAAKRLDARKYGDVVDTILKGL